MGAPPFPEAIAFERTCEPFGSDPSPSMQLRRKLLHGERISADTAEKAGATKSLVYVLVGTMRKWGFNVEQENEDGVTYYRVTNRDHVPTEENRPEVVRKAPKPKVQIPEGIRVLDANSGRAKIILRLAKGEVMTAAKVTAMNMDSTMLKKAVKAYEDAGYEVERQRTGSGNGIAYQVDLSKPRRDPAKKAASQNGSSRSEALVRQPAELDFGEQFGTDDWMPPVSGLTPVPQLDSGLIVYLTYRDPKDGSVKVGIRNGTESWLCTVDGHVAPGVFDHAAG